MSKLYRSRSDKMVAGVCGGLGAYLNVDPVIIRLFFIVLALVPGPGVLLYVLLWVLIPYDGQAQPAAAEGAKTGADEMADRVRGMGEDVRSALHTPNPQAALLVGGALIVLGVMYLLRNLNIAWLRWMDWGALWPLLLIAAGLALIWRRLGKGE